MKVTILGNNSAIPAHGRNPSAQIVEIKEQVFLVDCGEGTQMQMNKYAVKRGKINHIFISHLHGDHYFGLIGLLNSMALLKRTTPLHLYGPEKLIAIIQLQLDACNAVLPYPLHFYAISDEGEAKVLLDNETFRVSCFPVSHRIPTHGFVFVEKNSGRKILPEKCAEYEVPQSFFHSLKAGENYIAENGAVIENEWVTEEGKPEKSYAYCADTLFTYDFVQHISGVDLMYHESTYLEVDKELATQRFHTTAKQAALVAKAAAAKHLLLGHYSTRYKDVMAFETEARSEFEHCHATNEGDIFEL